MTVSLASRPSHGRAAAAGAALLLAVVPNRAQATDVSVRVENVIGAVGTLRVGVCERQEYRSRICHYSARAPAQSGEMTLLVQGVPPGRYAIIAHHDRNDDGKVNTNWLGIPTEGVGVSLNVTGHFGPPSFDETAVDVRGDRFALPIVLRREPRAQ